MKRPYFQYTTLLKNRSYPIRVVEYKTDYRTFSFSCTVDKKFKIDILTLNPTYDIFVIFIGTSNNARDRNYLNYIHVTNLRECAKNIHVSKKLLIFNKKTYFICKISVCYTLKRGNVFKVGSILSEHTITFDKTIFTGLKHIDFDCYTEAEQECIKSILF